MDFKNILVFPCGTEISLEIHNALKYFKYFKLYGASSVEDHGRMVYENYIKGVPFIEDKNFLEKFNLILKKHKIDYVIPAHDSVVLELSRLEKDLACEIVTSPFETCDICRSKLKTYKEFPSISPKVYETFEEVIEFPVFLKPDIGQGSQGIAKANNQEELFSFKDKTGLLILEYLPGAEYTVDCFSNKEGHLLFSGMRERVRTRNGISVHSKTIEVIPTEVVKIAKIINETLRLRGMWFFQVKLDINNNYKLLEIAPRVSGTMCLYRNNGVNFPLLSIYDRLGYEVNILDNKLVTEVDRALTNRFNFNFDYDLVYVDFDDTIIVNNKINNYLLMFLYQCINENKEIVLITKHIENITDSLEKHKISKKIFSNIILLKATDDKAEYMSKTKKAIFIDDSFAERKNVREKLNIPCFDLDMIESLINWKR